MLEVLISPVDGDLGNLVFRSLSVHILGPQICAYCKHMQSYAIV